MLEFIWFYLELVSHLVHCDLINPIWTTLLNHFIDLNQKLCSECNLINDFTFLADIMIFVRTKKSTVCTDSCSVLDADNFNLSAVFFAKFFLYQWSFHHLYIVHRLRYRISLFLSNFALLSVWNKHAFVLFRSSLLSKPDKREVLGKSFRWLFSCTLRSTLKLV